jgi:hypothetical protein
LRNRHSVLDQPAESELVAKTLKEHHPTEVSQMGVFEGYMQCSQAFWHAKREGKGPLRFFSQTVLKGRFMNENHYSRLTLKLLPVPCIDP